MKYWVLPLLSVVAAACSEGSGANRVDPGGADASVLGPSIGDDAGVPTDAGLPPPDAASPSTLEPTGCITAVGSGDNVFTCDGVKYDVRLPASCTSGGCGLVLDVHGLSMSSAMEDANTNMRAIGEREGYVVVQPTAPGTPPTTTWTPSKDYEKVWAFVTTARQAYKIDPKRVHVTGFSQGGAMTWGLTCTHSDEIASSAPSALSGCDATALAAVKRQVPVLYMHGKNDGLVSFDEKAAPQRDDVVTTWGMGAPATVSSDANYTWSRYTNANGVVFEFIEHQYAAASTILKGHCFPGSTDDGSAKGQLFSFACKPPNAFVWGEEAMKFFKAHPMP